MRTEIPRVRVGPRGSMVQYQVESGGIATREKTYNCDLCVRYRNLRMKRDD